MTIKPKVAIGLKKKLARHIEDKVNTGNNLNYN